MASDIDALRRQLQQLQSDHAAGALDDAAYQSQREALEQRIVALVMQGAAPMATAPTPAATALTAAAVRTPWRLLATVGAVVLVVAAAGYSQTGSWRAALAPPTAAQEAAAPDAEQIAAMVDKLAQHLKEKPDDVEGWRMLGRSYLVMSRPADAAAALKQAVALRGDDAGLLADYADALAVVNNRDISGEPMALVTKALQIDPNNIKALSLAGSAAFTRQDFKSAVTYWERVAALAPPDSGFIERLQESIAEARQRAGMPPAPVAVAQAPAPTPTQAPGTAPAATAGRSVSGTVTLAASLRSKVSPDDTVFVFARAAKGPRMPLAILRKQVKDLPFEFVLDDSSAMSPALRLSAFEQVVIGARVSKSGEALPRPGDLTAQSEPLAPGAKGLKLEISQVVAQ